MYIKNNNDDNYSFFTRLDDRSVEADRWGTMAYRASAAAREASRARGHARRDGAHPHCDAGCCSSTPGSVETATL